jgi:hypothetical protein
MPSTRAARTTRSNDPLSGHGTPGALRVSVGVSSGRRVTVCSVTFPASAASLGCAGLDFFPRSQEGDPLFCVERGSSFVEGGHRVSSSRQARDRASAGAYVRASHPRLGAHRESDPSERCGIAPEECTLGEKGSEESMPFSAACQVEAKVAAGAIRHATRPSWSLRRVSARAPSGPIRRMGRCAARSCKRRSRAACRPSTPPKTNGTCNPRDP